VFRIALKSVLARKGRMLLSSLGVIASCTFLCGVFVFGDTIQGSFDRLFANAYANVDTVVRSSNAIEGDFGDDARDRIPSSLADEIRSLPGVAEVQPDVQSFARVTTADGTAVGIDGPPKFGGVYSGSENSPWALAEGRAPAGPDEVVIDRKSAESAKISIGDTVDVTATEVRSFEVVGIATFAGNDTSGGASWALFDLATAEEFVVGTPGQVDLILVAGDGSVSETELRDAVQSKLSGETVEVLTGTEIIEESQSSIAEGFKFFTTFLTIFAGIATFVGCFIIYNVFKISAAQRLRENALLRAVGARSSQVVKAQMVEAVAVGVLGGLLGFVGGIALATVIIALLTAIGFAPSDSALSIQFDTFVWTMVVGLVVTLVCAVLPALRAGRTPPLAAMRDVSVDRSGTSRRRVIVGVVSVVVSILGVTLGLTSDTNWLVPGVLGLFVALIAFGPLIVTPLALALVPPLRAIRGVTGEVAARNAARSPERTALTAAALGICLALLVGVSTLGTSIIASFRSTVGEQFRGDISVSTSDQGSGGGLPTTLVDELTPLPEVGDVVAFGGAPVRLTIGGEPEDSLIVTVNADAAENLIDFSFTGQGWDAVRDTSVVVPEDFASENSLEVGDTIGAGFLDGTTTDLTIVGLFDSPTVDSVVADRSLLTDVKTIRFDVQILATAAPGTSVDEARDAIAVVAETYPTAKVQTRDEFIDSQIDQLGGFLNFIYALLGMSVFIAVLGIVLTLLLSVYERRRELGLVRAVGMTRSQVRSSVRWESIVTALLGAVIGVVLGLTLGWIVVQALKDQGLNTFDFSAVSVLAFSIGAIGFALVAAWLPARKAAKADILQAIATT
jgi:putative ABC transport system permease protein